MRPEIIAALTEQAAALAQQTKDNVAFVPSALRVEFKVVPPRIEIGLPPERGFLRFWSLFQFILDKRTRQRIFEPAYEDMKAQYIESRRYSTKWAQRWLAFAFSYRFLAMALECFRTMLFGSLTQPLQQILLEILKHWCRPR